MIHNYNPVQTTTITDNQLEEVMSLFRTISEWCRQNHDTMVSLCTKYHLSAIQLNYNVMAAEYKMPEMTIELISSGRSDITTISSWLDWELYLQSKGVVVEEDPEPIWADEEGEETIIDLGAGDGRQ